MKKKLIILFIGIAAAIIAATGYVIMRPKKINTPQTKAITETYKQEVQRQLSAIPYSAVAYNNWPESCYVVYDGYVYDISEYLKNDSTKKTVLAAYCGSDITSVLNNKKDSSGKKVDIGFNDSQAIKNAWQNYLVGALQKNTGIELK